MYVSLLRHGGAKIAPLKRVSKKHSHLLAARWSNPRDDHITPDSVQRLAQRVAERFSGSISKW